MDFPNTLQSFCVAFPDETACLKALRRTRWPKGFVCPRCEYRKSTFIQTRRLEQCRRCRYQCSVTAGTVFHGTRTPLLTWFWAIFFVGRHKQGISALQLQQDLGLGSYQTAWTMLHKLRSAMKPRAEFRLDGLVEADETYVGGHEPGLHGGREAGSKAIVAIAVENRGAHAGQARLRVIQGLTFEHDLGPFIRGVVNAPETTLRTDGYKSYQGFPRVGIRHDRQIQGDPARAAEVLPWSHTVFGNLKTWLRGTFHGVSGKHLQSYLDEFCYRFDRRRRDDLPFYVLRRAATGKPLPYRTLVAEPAG